jgi:hypothetical protein
LEGGWFVSRGLSLAVVGEWNVGNTAGGEVVRKFDF